MHCCFELPTPENKHSSLIILGLIRLLGIKVTVRHQRITSTNFSTKTEMNKPKKNKNSIHSVVHLSGQRPVRHNSEKQDDPIKNRLSDHPTFYRKVRLEWLLI